MENNNQISYAKTMSEAESMACDIVRKNNSKMRDKSNETIKQEGFVFNSNKEGIVRKALDCFIKYAIDKKIEFTLKQAKHWWIIKEGNVNDGISINYIRGDIPKNEPATKTHYFMKFLLEHIADFENKKANSDIIRHSDREISYQRAIFDYFHLDNYVAIIDKDIDDNINDLKIPQNISLICVGNVERVKTEENDSPEKNEKVEKSNSVTFGRNILLYGAPGTGKSHTAQQIVKNNAKDDKTCKELKLDNMPAGKSVRVTFHPDTDYASFVGCYKPSMNDKEEIVYKFVPQAFLKIYVDAWKNLISDEKTDEKKQYYYLVIEELNRGNCAQIFGDIFQLLDRNDEGYSDYYIWADTDVVKYLKSEEGFGNNYEKYCKKLENIFKELKDADKKDWGVLALPSNLTILATMNTSDQSLFPIDSAFKRRWEWKYVKINYDAEDLKDVKLWDGIGWLAFIKAINKYIADKTHSADKQIGERFVKPKDSKIDYETFRDKVMFYLFNDVFKDDESFGKDVFEDENGIHLFGDLTEENAKKFIKNKLLVQ